MNYLEIKIRRGAKRGGKITSWIVESDQRVGCLVRRGRFVMMILWVDPQRDLGRPEKILKNLVLGEQVILTIGYTQ